MITALKSVIQQFKVHDKRNFIYSKNQINFSVSLYHCRTRMYNAYRMYRQKLYNKKEHSYFFHTN